MISPRITRLEKIFRQGERSEIIATAHSILEGVPRVAHQASRLEDVDPEIDLTLVVLPEPERCLHQLVRLCSRAIPYWYKDIDPVMDVQVLAPMHKGVCGIANLNSELQKALNPNAVGITVGGQQFQVGDKIMQQRNHYDKGLFNGDLGRVTSIDPDGKTLVADFDGETHEFGRGELGDLSVAYAISIHKSQGSEFPIVVIPLLKAHFVMLQRNLIYTAITRGRKKVFLVGDPAAYSMAIRNTEATVRVTGLSTQLRR